VGRGGHWVKWHEQYDDPRSSLSRRLAVVQSRLSDALDHAAEGHINLIAMCAGQGRDVIPVLARHPRSRDVAACLVELDPILAAEARAMAEAARLAALHVVEADASTTTVYEGAVPAGVVMVCGVFGNISDADIHATVSELPHLCAPGATVMWTRHRRAPDLTPAIRGWFLEAGFQEVAFDSGAGVAFGVGTHRLVRVPPDFRPGRQMFTFLGDGADAHF